MATKAISQHKRMAMGEKVGFARGGVVPVPNLVPRPTGRAINPIRAAKMTNSVPGFKKGGKAEK
jgi:hypothetical protein